MDLTRTYQHKGQTDILAALEAHSGQQLSSAAVLGVLGDGRWDWALTDMANFLQKWSEEKHEIATLRTVPHCLVKEQVLQQPRITLISGLSQFCWYLFALALGLRQLVLQFLDFDPEE